MVQLGQEIKALRQAQSLSLQHIHAHTKVPLYHLQALESGQVQGMPEPIFVRGFLQRICTCLGEDGVALLAKLPSPVPVVHQPLPQFDRFTPAAQLSTAHLYLGYGALLVGAVGGLAWIGHQEATQQAAPTPNSQFSRQPSQTTPSQLSSTTQAALARTSMQPEQFAPELS